MSHCGVVEVGTKEVMPNILPIKQFVEKPEPAHAIYRSTRAFGIVGRYLLQPSIFPPLRQFKEEERRPVHLTDALERLRQEGHHVYAFELEATREDVGEVLGQAGELMGDSSETSSTA
jgi:UTP--glucose-1-phosphate uridylyltransferase